MINKGLVLLAVLAGSTWAAGTQSITNVKLTCEEESLVPCKLAASYTSWATFRNAVTGLKGCGNGCGMKADALVKLTRSTCSPDGTNVYFASGVVDFATFTGKATIKLPTEEIPEGCVLGPGRGFSNKAVTSDATACAYEEGTEVIPDGLLIDGFQGALHLPVTPQCGSTVTVEAPLTIEYNDIPDGMAVPVPVANALEIVKMEVECDNPDPEYTCTPAFASIKTFAAFQTEAHKQTRCGTGCKVVAEGNFILNRRCRGEPETSTTNFLWETPLPDYVTSMGEEFHLDLTNGPEACKTELLEGYTFDYKEYEKPTADYVATCKISEGGTAVTGVDNKGIITYSGFKGGIRIPFNPDTSKCMTDLSGKVSFHIDYPLTDASPIPLLNTIDITDYSITCLDELPEDERCKIDTAAISNFTEFEEAAANLIGCGGDCTLEAEGILKLGRKCKSVNANSLHFNPDDAPYYVYEIGPDIIVHTGDEGVHPACKTELLDAVTITYPWKLNQNKTENIKCTFTPPKEQGITFDKDGKWINEETGNLEYNAFLGGIRYAINGAMFCQDDLYGYTNFKLRRELPSGFPTEPDTYKFEKAEVICEKQVAEDCTLNPTAWTSFEDFERAADALLEGCAQDCTIAIDGTVTMHRRCRKLADTTMFLIDDAPNYVTGFGPIVVDVTGKKGCGEELARAYTFDPIVVANKPEQEVCQYGRGQLTKSTVSTDSVSYDLFLGGFRAPMEKTSDCLRGDLTAKATFYAEYPFADTTTTTRGTGAATGVFAITTITSAAAIATLLF